jgi:phosphatidate cytidylyltransferase
MRVGGMIFNYFIIFITVLMLYELINIIFQGENSPLLHFKKKILFFTVGFIYIIFFSYCFWHIRNQEYGLALICTLLILTWTSDIGGYIFGILLQGPKIAPRISPSKTWSGFFGGLILTCVAIYFLESFLKLSHIFLAPHHIFSWIKTAVTPNFTPFPAVYLLAIITHVIGQMGDLLESWFKRRFGVKDSGALIPGHGGLLDRLDSVAPTTIFWYFLMNF